MSASTTACATTAAAYVLGALDDDGGRELRRARCEACAECREEVAELQRGRRRAAARGRRRSRRRRSCAARIMAVVESEAELLHAAGRGAPIARRDRAARAAAWSAAAARPLPAGGARLRRCSSPASAAGLLVGGGGADVVAHGGRAKVDRDGAANAGAQVESATAARSSRRRHAGAARRHVYQVWLVHAGDGAGPDRTRCSTSTAPARAPRRCSASVDDVEAGAGDRGARRRQRRRRRAAGRRGAA